MKCPKCGYLGFERVERCRNCGYDFPTAEFRGLPELPLRGRDAGHVGLLDLALSNPSTESGSEAPGPTYAPDFGRTIKESSNTPGDLPLFGSVAAEARPLGPRPLPARPPLAVRRATPEVPRVRVDQPRAPMLDRGLTDPVPRAVAAARQGPTAAAEPASLTARVLAGIIDLVLLAAIDGLVVYFTLQICGLTFEEVRLLPKGPLLAFLLVQNGGYLVAFTAGGQTLGKMAAGIKVVPEAGAGRMDLGQSAMRTFVWALLAIPAGLGFLTALFDDDHRGLHDRLAGTRVVRAGAA
jgi:uncharacterized RDD family membrane protein YckC